MKVVYLVPSLIKCGPINVVYNIVKNLDRKNFIPIIVALSEPAYGKQDLKPEFEKLGLQVIAYAYQKWQLELHIRKIARSLQHRFAGANVIFHAHGYYPTLLLSYMRNVLSVTTLHNRCGEDFRMSKGFLLGNYMTFTYLRALSLLCVRVAISQTMQNYYQDRGIQTNMVYNGVTIPPVSTYEQRKEARYRLGVTNNAPVLLYPAVFSQRKNQLWLIKELKKSQLKFTLLFAGQGSTEKACKTVVGNDDRFKFLGFQMNLEPLWTACDFLISASFSEGLPMAVLEALVRGVPCVLSDIPPHKEIMEHIHDGGTCFSLQQEGALQQVLTQVLARIYDRESIREQAAATYSAQVMSQDYEKIYRQVFDKATSQNH